MFDKDTLRDEMLRECDIIRHLATKIPEGTDDWKPTEGQRTMLQSLRYLSFAPLGGARTMVANDWPPKAHAAIRQRRCAVTAHRVWRVAA